MSPTISGTVNAPDGSDQANAKVCVVDTGPSPENWEVVGGDTTDSNGNFSISVSETGTDRYHVFVQYEDGTNYYRADSYPFISVS